MRNKLSTSRDAKGLIAFLGLKLPQTEVGGGGGNEGEAKVPRPSRQSQEPTDKDNDIVLQVQREVRELRRSQELMQDMVQQVNCMLSNFALIVCMMHGRRKRFSSMCQIHQCSWCAHVLCRLRTVPRS